LIGVQDKFNSSGVYDELLDENGLSPKKITDQILKFMGKKK
jgi:transketolase C-terminal domain/subunit